MLRVIQWATGPVGRHAIAAIVNHPELDLPNITGRHILRTPETPAGGNSQALGDKGK